MYMKQKYIRQIHCHSCNKIIDKPPSLTNNKYNFCDHKCYSKYKKELWSNKNNPRWSGGEINFNCKFCGKPFKRIKGKRINKYCSIDCAAKDRGKKQIGKNHWNWKGRMDTRYLRKIAPRPKPERCEICNKLGSDFHYGLHYDHDHKTGKFRGWICPNCNTALGLVQENTKTLEALIKYINENSL